MSTTKPLSELPKETAPEPVIDSEVESKPGLESAAASLSASALAPASDKEEPEKAPGTSGGKSKKATKKGGKKTRKVNGSAKQWVNFVLEVFNKKRAKNPSYKYKQAMKDAAKLKKKNKSLKM